MSSIHPQPDAPETDELVAYLDGELSADECRRVERRLASDADYRRQLSELERAWTALEALPQTVVDDDFARTTIEMVAVVAERDVSEKSATRTTAGRRRTYWTAAFGVALAVATFAAAKTLIPGPNDLLIRDLPVIAQLDALTQVEDVAYLRGLSRLGIASAGSITAAAGGAAIPTVSSESVRVPSERRAWIEALPPESKAELAANFERFQRQTSPEEQERLRTLERQIAKAADHDKLQKTMASYCAWLQGRTSGEKLELRELPTTAERLRRAEELFSEGGRPLSLEDENALQEAILEFVAHRRPAFLRTLERRGNPEWQQRVAQHPTAWLALAIIRWDMRDDDRRDMVQDRLTSQLSPEAQEYFDGLKGRQRSRQLWQWIGNAMRPELGPQELEKFFTGDELSNDERERLLSLPRADMEEQLRQMYISSQIGLGEREWGDGFGRPGEFGRGGPPPEFEPRGFDRDRRRRPARGDFDGRPPGRRGLPPFPPAGPPPDGENWGPPPHQPGPADGSPPNEAT